MYGRVLGGPYLMQGYLACRDSLALYRPPLGPPHVSVLQVGALAIAWLSLQGYLAHKQTPTPLGLPRTLGIGLRQGPRGVRFLVSEVPLYASIRGNRRERKLERKYRGTSLIRNTPLLRPYSGTIPRILWWP